MPKKLPNGEYHVRLTIEATVQIVRGDTFASDKELLAEARHTGTVTDFEIERPAE